MWWKRIALVLAALFLPAHNTHVAYPADRALAYPTARVMDQVDTYHGVQVRDPYRWLEEADSSATQAWVQSERALTEQYLSQVPEREQIRNRLTELWDYEKRSLPYQRGQYWFYSHNTGLQNHSVLYVARSLDDPESRVIIDPNVLSTDGSIAVPQTSPSRDGTLVAYAISRNGSDWREIRIRSVESGTDLQDTLRWVKFSGISWDASGEGFYYSRYDEPKLTSEADFNQRIWYHKVETAQASDRLIYERPDQPKWSLSGRVTEDGRYLVISAREGTDSKNRLYLKDLKEDVPVMDLLPKGDAGHYFVGNQGSTFWFATDLDAPRSRVVTLNIKAMSKGLQEIIPESSDTLDDVSLIGGHLAVAYLKDAHTVVHEYTLDGKLIRDVPLPGIGTVYGFSGDANDRYTTYGFTSFTAPASIYRYDTRKGTSELLFRPATGVNPDNFVVEQVFYSSKDGTRIPMFVIYKKGLERNGINPTYLNGYGGFNIPMLPGYRPGVMVWLEMGGVYALPNLRGGGEYGEDWHQAGKLLNKQNVFDDFIAAARWLIDNDYTCPSKLAIGGGSNGGLLVGATMVQQPQLFAAAIPEVGVLDMMRYQLWTAGRHWTVEYGTVADPEQFKALLAYSPVHNVRKGTKYPATLVMAAEGDDRVVPAHSYKFAATLQAAQDSSAPILIRIETKAGHGGSTPTTQQIEAVADKWAFLVDVLGMNPHFAK